MLNVLVVLLRYIWKIDNRLNILSIVILCCVFFLIIKEFRVFRLLIDFNLIGVEDVLVLLYYKFYRF